MLTRIRPSKSRASLLLAALLLQSAAAQPQATKPAPQDFATLSAQAQQASEQNRLDEAIALYRKALAVRPAWAEGWWSLGTIQYDRNSYKEAASAFERLTALQPKKGSPRVMLGLCQFELGDDEHALKNIQEGRQLGTNPDSQFQQVMLYHEGLLLLRKAHFESAAEVFWDLSAQGVRSDELALGLGMTALRMLPKDLPAESDPGREVVRRVGQAESLAALKRFDEAKRAYSDLVSNYPNFPNMQYAYGHFLLNANDPDAAVAAFQQELKNSPQNVPARLQIAAARYRLDSTAGLPYAQEAVKLAPQLPFAHYLLGLLLLDTGDFASAIPELEFARKGLSQEAGVYFALGNAYAKAGRKEDAANARLTFARLNKQSKERQSSNVYGDQPKVHPDQ